MKNIKRENIIALSVVKAAVYAVVLPIIMTTLISSLKSVDIAFYSLLSYYFVFSMGYYFSNRKQLTAYYYFIIIKFVVVPAALLYTTLIVLAFVISKFF